MIFYPRIAANRLAIAKKRTWHAECSELCVARGRLFSDSRIGGARDFLNLASA